MTPLSSTTGFVKQKDVVPVAFRAECLVVFCFGLFFWGVTSIFTAKDS